MPRRTDQEEPLSTDSIWPVGPQALERGGTVIAELARVPVLPTWRITCAIAAAMSRFPLKPSRVSLVLGTATGEGEWHPIVGGSSSIGTESGTVMFPMEDTTTERLPVSTEPIAPSSCSRLASALLDGMPETSSLVTNSSDVPTTLAVRSSRSPSSIVEATWGVASNDLPSETVLHLEFLLRCATRTIDQAFPSGIEDTPRLTVTELRVVRMLLDGYKTPEIAAKSKCSPHTVHDHVKSVYRKLDVNTREQVFSRVLMPNTETLA